MKYQYTIQIQFKNGAPYYTGVYDYLDEVLLFLNEKIKIDKHYKRVYYVYNEFFNNEFKEDMAVSKYKILIRQVGRWNDFHNFSNYINESVDNEILM